MEETNSLARSRRMGEMPEGKLLLSMAVPMMLSMLVQALYNIVDSVYVAKVSEDCLSALSLAFPAQNILIGLATGTGVGVSTMLSRALGSRDNKLANRVAGNSLFLCVCCWIIMAIFGIFFADAFIHSQTDIESIRSYGDSYLRIVTIGSVFVYFEINFERLLQSTGQTKLSMWAQIIGAVANIILDPFFIYGWCGLPAMAPPSPRSSARRSARWRAFCFTSNIIKKSISVFPTAARTGTSSSTSIASAFRPSSWSVSVPLRTIS